MSSHSNSIRGQWDVCSGGIKTTELSPLAAARREIQEQTGCTEDDVVLLWKGKPFRFDDHDEKRRWIVHPFAFRMKSAVEFMLSREHTGYRFINPYELGTYDHVPRLEIGMVRVLISSKLEKGLTKLRDDHDSGAHNLAQIALLILVDIVRYLKAHTKSPSEFWKAVRMEAWHISKNGRPTMGAAIQSHIITSLFAVQKKMPATMSETNELAVLKLSTSIETAIQATMTSRCRSTLHAIVPHLLQYIHSDVTRTTVFHMVSISSSGTVALCLTALIIDLTTKGIHVKLTILESRPRFEGVEFVNKLLARSPHLASNHMLDIVIVADASLGSIITEADLLLLGADKVLPNGDVSNKIGSCAAAVLAKTLNPRCRVVSVFTTDKIAGCNDLDDEIEYVDEAELRNSWPERQNEDLERDVTREGGCNVEVKNWYFEWVERRWIDACISETGVMSADDIKRIARKTDELEEIVFGDL